MDFLKWVGTSKFPLPAAQPRIPESMAWKVTTADFCASQQRWLARDRDRVVGFDGSFLGDVDSEFCCVHCTILLVGGLEHFFSHILGIVPPPD